MTPDLLIAFSLLTVGFLYASVGHGGASGYIAVFSLFALPVVTYKPLILVLNVIVSFTAFYQFYKAGYFKWNLCWPFLITSIPFAFLGSKVMVAGEIFHLLLGLALVFPIVRLLGFGPKEKKEKVPISFFGALIWGIILGFAAGMLNIGGGIFLSPLLILLAWANAKEAAAVSSLFIMFNSIAGLLGNANNHYELTAVSILWFFATIAGGMAGAFWGSRRFDNVNIRYMLSAVMGIASIKLIFFM